MCTYGPAYYSYLPVVVERKNLWETCLIVVNNIVVALIFTSIAERETWNAERETRNVN